MATTSRPLDIKLPPLHPGQQQVYDSQARFKVVCCGRRWGKTHLGVLTCIVVAARGGRAWWIGPSYPVAGIGWRLLKAIVSAIPGCEVKEAERMILFPNGGVVQVKSADRPDSLRGESLDWVVFDEVADIKEEAWFEGIRPALADRKGGALFIGTPRGMDNWFYDLFVRATNEKGATWEAWQQPTLANPYVPPEEVEDARKDMHPIIFNQEFLAEFVVAGGTVFHDSWQKWYQLVGDQHMFMKDSTLVFMHEDHIYETVGLAGCLRFSTVDLALSTKTSADYTVIACWAMTPQKRLALLDFWRKRVESPEILPNMARLRSRWKLAWHGVEKVAFQASIIQQGRRQGVPIRELKPDKDKMARAYTAAAHMEGGRIWWRKTIPEMTVFSGEVMNFPLAAHDDCTDTVSYAAANLDKLYSGPQIVSW
jgi:predicted phage terminase large subunit-like protein